MDGTVIKSFETHVNSYCPRDKSQPPHMLSHVFEIKRDQFFLVLSFFYRDNNNQLCKAQCEAMCDRNPLDHGIQIGDKIDFSYQKDNKGDFLHVNDRIRGLLRLIDIHAAYSPNVPSLDGFRQNLKAREHKELSLR